MEKKFEEQKFCRICEKRIRFENKEKICRGHSKAERKAFFDKIKAVVRDNREIMFLMLPKQEVLEIVELKNKVLYEKPLVLK